MIITRPSGSLHGEYKQEEEHKKAAYHIREQLYGRFERSLVLPVDVQTDKAEAEFKDGILTVRLLKAGTVRPKTITVKAK